MSMQAADLDGDPFVDDDERKRPRAQSTGA